MKKWSISQLILGPVQTNCYVIVNEETKECVIIDPADRADGILAEIKGQGAKPVAVLLTHGHFDHMAGAKGLQAEGIPVYMLDKEASLAADPHANASFAFIGRSVVMEGDEYLWDGQVLELLGMKIKVIGTPGHTAGSCCYYLEEEGVLFSGDTLFFTSYGRTDLPTGSEAEIWRSIREKLLVLPEDTIVYPGHGEATSIAFEKQHNPAS